jgi:hypothetical protein
MEDRMKALAVAIAVLCAVSSAAESPRLLFQEHGFSITALPGADDQQVHQVLIMMLPASDSFAPNVNVQIQPFGGTLDQYVAISRQQFQQAQWQVLGEEVGRDAAAWECSGELEGSTYHWYIVAHSAGARVYLVTATALEQQWDGVGATLVECVDSFRLERGM